jgi:hypothetical protein
VYLIGRVYIFHLLQLLVIPRLLISITSHVSTSIGLVWICVIVRLLVYWCYNFFRICTVLVALLAAHLAHLIHVITLHVSVVCLVCALLRVLCN